MKEIFNTENRIRLKNLANGAGNKLEREIKEDMFQKNRQANVPFENNENQISLREF